MKVTPKFGDLILTKDLWINGEYETVGIFMGFEELRNYRNYTYKRMNILLGSDLTFAFVNSNEEQKCIEVLCRAATGRSDEL
jgi:hypothetical protein